MENKLKRTKPSRLDAVITRKIDEGYRIVLPKAFREHLFMEIGESVMLSIEGERIVIEKPTHCCRMCGSSENYDFAIKLCRSCLEKTGTYYIDLKRGK